MAEFRGGGPPISVRATRTILNPWYELPAHVTVVDAGLSNVTNERLEITSPCRVELEKYDIRLFFQNNEVVFVFTGGSLAPRYLVNPMLRFLTYKTFINYNLIGPATNSQDASAFDAVDHIRFKIEQISRVETEIEDGGNVIKAFYHTGKDEWLEIKVESMVQYLRVLNPTLDYALAFYLSGCDNPRYFLIEFYKAVEAVTKMFHHKKEFLKSLKPYGVIESKFDEFGKYCNDAQFAPMDIGRHAPKPNAPLYSVDLRNLLAEPHSREVFESSTVFCRKVIDAYISFLIHQAG